MNTNQFVDVLDEGDDARAGFAAAPLSGLIDEAGAAADRTIPGSDGQAEKPALLAARWYQRGLTSAAPPRERRRALPEPEPEDRTAVTAAGSGQNPGLEDAKLRVHRRLIQELEASRLDRMNDDEARSAVAQAARHVLTQEAPEIFGLARDELISAVTDEVLGLGPIEPLLRDPSVSEVMVNAPDQVFFERNGKLQRSPVRFRDGAHILRICERIVSRIGRRVDESSPMVDARLPDGSRVNIIIPPVSPKSATITIRKFRADKMKLDDLVSVGSIPPAAAAFIRASVKIRKNIIVSGGTGSGKTTMLNALSGAIPDDERLVTIEDPSELRLQQPHVVTLEARPPSVEGKHEVTQRDLVRNALRMRPDRIIIGEVRGAEAFDMLQAMNTGHEGSISTIHANTPRDALARIESLVLMTGMDLPLRVIREQIASAIQLFIQIARFSDGTRRVSHITEVTGLEGQTVTLQDIFVFVNEGMDAQGRVRGELRATGIRPTFADQFALVGIDIPVEMFQGVQRWTR
ncbi:MAG: CpaF family protein [Dehalococcoidia bacterium]